MSLEKENVYLFEVVIKNMHIPKQYSKKPSNKGTKYRMRVQFGSKIDLSYFVPEHEDTDIISEYKGGLSVLMNWSTLDLIGNNFQLLIYNIHTLEVIGHTKTILGLDGFYYF